MSEQEIIDSAQLAERWHVPESWVRSRVRSRTATAEQIPHLQLGRWVRFEWGSPALEQWLARHREGAQEKPAFRGRAEENYLKCRQRM
jgi:hypothetical protein